MPMEMFNGPIPGQSLSKPMGSMPHDNPPQYAELNDALEYTFKSLSEPRQVTRLVLMLKRGIPVEYIACTLIMMGFGKGKWTPDVGLMMLRTVMAMIMSIAEIKGVKYTIFNPDKQQNDFLDNFLDMAPETNNVTTETSISQPAANDIKFTGLLGGSL